MIQIEVLIIVAMATAAPSIIFGVFLWLQTREERANAQGIAIEAYKWIAAKNAKDGAEAAAIESYQEEAMREQALEFDRADKELRKRPPKADDEKVKLRDANGTEYEVIAGLD